MFKKRSLIAAVAAIATMGLGAGSASAATYVHAGTTTGNVLAAGSTITSGLESGTSAVLSTSIGTVTCTVGGFDATVGASGGATVTGTLNSLFFGPPCTDTVPFINITSCTKTATPVPGITATATGHTGGTVNLTNVRVRCTLSSGLGYCDFQANTANGTYTNTGATLRYQNVSVALVSGTGSSGLCPSSGTFSAAFAPVHTASGANVIINTTP